MSLDLLCHKPTPVASAQFRDQFNGLKELIDDRVMTSDLNSTVGTLQNHVQDKSPPRPAVASLRCTAPSRIARQEVAKDVRWVAHADLHVVQRADGCARIDFSAFDEISRHGVKRDEVPLGTWKHRSSSWLPGLPPPSGRQPASCAKRGCPAPLAAFPRPRRRFAS